MSTLFLVRLILDMIAASLLLLALAYWWLGNGVHELAGTAMFLLVIAHNVFNRRWYGTISRPGWQARKIVNVSVTALLATTMLVLLVTSIVISRTLPELIPGGGGFTMRQIHILAAYWALIIVSVHLGLRWPMIMGVVRTLLGISLGRPSRTLALRLVTAALAITGIWASFELGIGSQLTMQTSLDWWNFEESVAGFFIRCISIAGLYIATTYYVVGALQAGRGATTKLRVPREL
ncbi:MAG: DUF4405 domain-containing protein [Rhodospirillales bacterium]|nr:DUF4405 domain-containing protein [Rhodospirillales bacterium]